MNANWKFSDNSVKKARPQMTKTAPEFSIILAAGKGTRMKSSSCHKVCFPVDGRPVISRALDVYNNCGIRSHIVVVGNLAGQVVETVGNEFRNAVFCYQTEQLGTANAVKTGFGLIERMGVEGDILLVAGDRLIAQSVMEQLFDRYFSGACDLALLTVPNKKGSSQGRLVSAPDSSPLAIFEMPDIRQKRTFCELRAILNSKKSVPASELRRAIERNFSESGQLPSEKKILSAFGEIWKIACGTADMPSKEALLEMMPEENAYFRATLPDSSVQPILPDDAESTEEMNTSVYLVNSMALRYALSRLDRNNAQKEEYLSDIVQILSSASKNGRPLFKCMSLRVDNPSQILGFNDPAELLEVEAHIKATQRQEKSSLPESRSFRSLQEWRSSFDKIFSGRDKQLLRELSECYGDDKTVLRRHISRYAELVAQSFKRFKASDKVFMVRSPGRVNVMGRHIDHQGGNCNLMTIGYETLMLVRPRDDDRVNLYNLDEKNFGERTFSIGELVSDLPWDDWLSLVNSKKLSEMISTYGVDWSQYVKAAVLRLQKKFIGTPLRGMDIVISGNVPPAAGLSSSSSLVVASAEAVVAANRLDTFPSQLVTLCGEGEWFVGTRGGSADHAAVKLGQKGKVVKVRFFNFAVEDVVPFPDDHVLAVCDSGIKAVKSANVKDQFNHRITCYRIGFRLIRKLFPQYSPLLAHLRDVSTRKLGIPLSWIYRLLLHLPETATREELQSALPDEQLDEFFSQHKPPQDGLYPIRGVVLFGLAEFERARLYADFLRDGKMKEIGHLMSISHDGDRVASFDENWNASPFYAPTGNIYLLNLIEDLESGDPERVNRAQLQWQAGSYHCSIPEIDKMVDVSSKIEGVVGAQLAGAGLGGCMMVLAHKKAVKDLKRRLDEEYYKKAGPPSSILVCKPVAGAGILMSENGRDRSNC